MTEPPPTLSSEAQGLLQAYRAARPMPDAVRTRVHERLESDVAPAPVGRSVWLWSAIGAAAAALLVWSAVGIGDARRGSGDADPAAQVPMQPLPGGTGQAEPQPRPAPMRVAPAEPVATPKQTLAQPEPQPEPEPVVPSRRRRAPEPEPEPEPEPPSPSTLAAENRLIAKTWDHVRSEDHAAAASTLREHAAQFPGGVLAPERRALVVIVDCLAHPETAAGKAQAYAAQGHTALLNKVRTSCMPSEKSPPR